MIGWTRGFARALLTELALIGLRLSARRVGGALVYHRIGDPPGNPARELVPALGSGLFGDQLRYLGRRFELVTASKLVEATRSRKRLRRIPVAITFDDDLEEHHSNARPLLEAEGAKATFFLSGDSGKGAAPPWWEWVDLASRTGRLAETLPSSLGLPSSADIHEVGAAIQRLPSEDREAIVAQLRSRLTDQDEPAGLSLSHIRGLAEAGFEIGFHTIRHDELTALDDQSVRAALDDGRVRLEELAGNPVLAIAYPYGKADGRVATAARKAGYLVGFTTDGRGIGPHGNVMLIGRISPSHTSVGETAWSLVRALRSPE